MNMDTSNCENGELLCNLRLVLPQCMACVRRGDGLCLSLCALNPADVEEEPQSTRDRSVLFSSFAQAVWKGEPVCNPHHRSAFSLTPIRHSADYNQSLQSCLLLPRSPVIFFFVLEVAHIMQKTFDFFWSSSRFSLCFVCSLSNTTIDKKAAPTLVPQVSLSVLQTCTLLQR